MAFDGTVVILASQVRLTVEVTGREEFMDFIVVHSYSPYTPIFGHPWIHSIGVVPSSLHLKVKFPTKQGIFKLHKDQSVAWRCQMAAIRHKKVGEVKPVNLL